MCWCFLLLEKLRPWTYLEHSVFWHILGLSCLLLSRLVLPSGKHFHFLLSFPRGQHQAVTSYTGVTTVHCSECSHYCSGDLAGPVPPNVTHTACCPWGWKCLAFFCGLFCFTVFPFTLLVEHWKVSSKYCSPMFHSQGLYVFELSGERVVSSSILGVFHWQPVFPSKTFLSSSSCTLSANW